MSVVQSIKQLIDQHGVWLGERKCARCGLKRMFAVRYDEKPADVFVVCEGCDTPKVG